MTGDGEQAARPARIVVPTGGCHYLQAQFDGLQPGDGVEVENPTQTKSPKRFNGGIRARMLTPATLWVEFDRPRKPGTKA